MASVGENVIVQLGDYQSGQPVLTVAGKDGVDNAIMAALGAATQLDMRPELSLVPEATVERLKDSSRFAITEDRDEADYVLSVSAAIHPSKERRRLLRRFEDATGQVLVVTDRLDAIAHQFDLVGLFTRWRVSRGLTEEETAAEKSAWNRICSTPGLQVDAICLVHDSELIGCSIVENDALGWATVHFAKADVRFPGVFARLDLEEALWSHRRGALFMNIEQDLGLAGLRTSKLAARPAQLLRKYRVAWA